MSNNTTIINVFSKKLKTILNIKSNFVSIKLKQNQEVNGIYKVIEMISVSSGEADLYKVLDLRNGSICVLKLFRRKQAIKAEILDKLLKLDNPNVADFLDKGEIQGFPYIVIPFYKNNSLGSYIEQGIRFNVDELKGLIIPSIADGLKAIHDEGIIHKDLKPSNLMISNDHEHIVLIDFGISAMTKGNTIVVTQTGKSPFYSAPETNTGLFLDDSDYYSLGITLYELVTGFTPYQNINIENLAGFAQIQKIPFPEGFNQDLKALIEGLTYKDISNRNDKSNPNRRWGYEEIQKWLKGERQPIPGYVATIEDQQRVIPNNINQMPYIFDGETFYDNKELVEALLLSWDLGLKELFRGSLVRHYELLENEIFVNICKQADHLYQLSSENSEIAFMNAMYGLEPDITKLYWQGLSFDSLYAYGLALLKELKQPNPRELLINSASTLLSKGILKSYVKLTRVDNKEYFLELIKNNTSLLTQNPLPPLAQAQRLGNALTNRSFIKLKDTCFESIAEFNDFIGSLYSKNLQEFANFCESNKVDLELQKNIFSGEQLKDFTKNLINENNTLTIGSAEAHYYFKNARDISLYIDTLLSQNRCQELLKFKSNCTDSMEDLLSKVSIEDQQALQLCLQKCNELFYFGDFVFSNVESFIEYVKQMKPSAKAQDFLMEHRSELTAIYKKQVPAKQQLILSKLGSSWLLQVGSYTKFGNYYCGKHNTFIGLISRLSRISSSLKPKEPIEWLVLALEPNRVLLLSKEGLAPMAFNENYGCTSWDKCSLRSWLNEEFLNDAFNEDERNSIIPITIENSRGGISVKDKVFLLSIDEVNQYIKNKENLICCPTNYAKHKSVYVNNNNNCCWWLRSSGASLFYAIYVNGAGDIYKEGNNVDYTNNAVRPAIWMKI